MKTFIIIILVVSALYGAVNNAMGVSGKLGARQAYALSIGD